MADRPWYPRNSADYIAATIHLSLEADGLYNRLLDWYWINGPIPVSDDASACVFEVVDNSEKSQTSDKPAKKLKVFSKEVRVSIAKIARVSPQTIKRLWPDIYTFFDYKDGGLHNKRMDKEIKQTTEIQEKRRKAAEKRWNANASNKNNANAHANASKERMQVDDASGYAVTNTITNINKDRQNEQKPEPEKPEVSTPANAAVNDEKKKSEEQKKVIWNIGIDILKQQGMDEPKARSFLGGLIKKSNQSLVAQKIAVLSTFPKADAKAWLMSACTKHDSKGRVDPEKENALIQTARRIGVTRKSGESFVNFKARVDEKLKELEEQRQRDEEARQEQERKKFSNPEFKRREGESIQEYQKRTANLETAANH